MCGIVGYVGAQEAAPILLDGLRRLEYRGYDSAGMAVCGPEGLQVCKTRGRLQALADLTEEGRTLTGTLGVGHTRWATHGEPNDINAHPQVSQSGLFAVVHNGIIENYALLRADGADINPQVKAMNSALHGRGGGRNGFAQGSVQASEGSIRNFFNNLT